jgi:hypothetical protein
MPVSERQDDLPGKREQPKPYKPGTLPDVSHYGPYYSTLVADWRKASSEFEIRRSRSRLSCYLIGASIATLAAELSASELKRNCTLLGDPPDELTREEADLRLRCVSWWEGYLDRVRQNRLFGRYNGRADRSRISPLCLRKSPAPESASLYRRRFGASPVSVSTGYPTIPGSPCPLLALSGLFEQVRCASAIRWKADIPSVVERARL